jgi:hypothetical protein
MRPVFGSPEWQRQFAEQHAPGTGEAVVASTKAEANYRDRVESSAVAHRGKVRAGASVAPSAAHHRAEYSPPVPMRRATRYIERFADSLRERGQRDACPAEIPEIAWAVGELFASSVRGAMHVIDTVLPDPLARGLVSFYSSRVCPVREVVDPVDGSVRLAPVIERGDHSELRFDLRRASDRKYGADLAVLYVMSLPTKRAGFGRVTSKYGLGARALCVPKADVRRSRPCKGETLGTFHHRYTIETWNGYSVDPTYGNHIGVAAVLRDVMSVHLCDALEMHQPDAAVVDPSERGPSGFAFTQVWFRDWATRGEWDATERRWVHSPEVAAFVGRKLTRREARAARGTDVDVDAIEEIAPSDVEALRAILDMPTGPPRHRRRRRRTTH